MNARAVYARNWSCRPSLSIVLILLALTSACKKNSQSVIVTAQLDAPEKVSENEQRTLLPVKVAGKWGYANSSGRLVIRPQFDLARDFREGRAGICVGSRCDTWKPNRTSHWGFIDTSGKVVVNPQFQMVADFSEGLAVVCDKGCANGDSGPPHRGYIDGEGKVVIPLQFGIAAAFHQGLARVCVGDCNWSRDNGFSGKFGFIDHVGRFVIKPEYDYAGDFSGGFASVTVGKRKDQKSGYVDKTGLVVWQPST